MLHVLTPGLLDELTALGNHPGMSYNKHEMVETILFDKGFSTSTDDVILDAVRYLNRTIGIKNNDRLWFIARQWFGKVDMTLQYPYDGSRSSDVGQWVYQYGRVYDCTLTISKKYMSAMYDYTSKGLFVRSNGNIFPVQSLVNSKEERYFKMMIPGNNDMFSSSELRYILPVSLLT